MRLWPAAVIALAVAQAAVPSVPQTEISNGAIRAVVYPPDPQTGYYRGTRFDWAGVVASLRWNGHEYFGQWFDKYDARIHDAISGPVEEFLTGDAGLGYAEAAAGDPFVRIGVGAVRKPAEPSYQRFATYEIVDPGRRSITKGRDWIELVHELGDARGYGYVYRKRLTLVNDTLVLEHQLKNTGRKPITTSVYDHNFFTLDRQTTGPDIVVRFPFAPVASPALAGLAEVRGSEVVFLDEFRNGQTVYTEMTGFGSTPRDYDFRIENRKTGAGVHITGDRPLSKLVFWSAWKTVCPEPYIDLSVAPGQETSWRITYQFYEAAPSAPRSPL
jgi:hypothetical protein